MRAIAINGSPRKNWNTATLLENALAGAAAQGAETKLVYLYDLHYQGCTSCFACKLRTGKSYGRCALNDDLAPILRQIEEADILLLGSPIYFGAVTGEMRSFLERLLFQYMLYDKNYSLLRKKAIPVGIIYTMNTTQAGAEARNYPITLGAMEAAIKRILSDEDVATLYVTDTYQFDDYEKYEVTAFSGAHKAKRRAEVFPEDCRKAYALGAELIARFV
ncbi:MAG: flavodoxin family protein [Myxococcales bacterium]|nr:flavodoxin family protein [Myxococcales bacterium]